MTKDEFDALFLGEKACIHHNTYGEWEQIVQYLVSELGLRIVGPVRSHNFEAFPYTFLRFGNRVSNIEKPGGRRVIPFEQFRDAVTEEEPELQCSLEEVL